MKLNHTQHNYNMKSKEEIEYLAANLANPNVCKTTNWIEGYTQCQEDMADKKYTKEDVLKAGEIGEINHHDYKHIVSLLDEARKLNKQD
jgi:hypothetical protein